MEIYGMTGEKLGTIGSSEASKNAEMPQWQCDFLSKPSISVRKGIAWGYDAPYEDTDTLVLTTPSSRFIDIRFPKDHDPSKPLRAHSAFWAFTGTSATTFPGTDDAPMIHVAHSVWKHDIDSKGPGISDEGDLFALPCGDCAEVGMMENPKTGKVEMYKEYWTSPITTSSGDALKPCVVAEVVSHGEAKKHRGLLIQIGDHCQGVLAYKLDVTVVGRWLRPPGQGHWQVDPRSGGLYKTESQGRLDMTDGTLLPHSWVCEDGRKEGDEIEVGKLGITWRIAEVLS